MWTIVIDRDNDICYHTQDDNDPDIQHHFEKYAYFDTRIEQVEEVWNVYIEEPDAKYSLYSSHLTEQEATSKVDSLQANNEYGYVYYVEKGQ